MKKCVFDNPRNCSALTQKKCTGCHFYKTEKDLQNGRAKAQDRIAALAMLTRLKIAEKYRKSEGEK